MVCIHNPAQPDIFSGKLNGVFISRLWPRLTARDGQCMNHQHVFDRPAITMLVRPHRIHGTKVKLIIEEHKREDYKTADPRATET